MKLTLNTYNGKAVVEIPDNTTIIAGVILTGDEVLIFPVYRDPMLKHRLDDFFDGSFVRKLVDGKWVDLDDDDLEAGKL